MNKKKGESLKGVLLLTLLTAVYCLRTTEVNAQISFEKAYGGTGNDQGYSVQQTSDGGYIVAGHKESLGEGTYLVKTDSMGDTLWTKTYGASQNDGLWEVRETSDGGYILVGWTTTVSFSNVYLIKTDSTGSAVWIKDFGGASVDGGYSVQQTSDGGYIIAGGTNSFGAGSGDVYLIKTTSSGDTVWTRTYGGSGPDGGECVQQTQDEGFIIAGYTRSFGSGLYDFYLVKTDSMGDTVWTRTYGGIWNEVGRTVQETSDGGYIVVGSTVSFGAGNGDAYVVKTDSQGDSVWTKTYGGLGVDNGYSIQETSDGGYILAGTTEFWGDWDVFLVKTDSVGDTLWTNSFGDTTEDRGYSVEQTLDGGYIIAGLTESFGASGQDVYLIKTAGDGSVGVDERTSDFRIQISDYRLFQNRPNPFQHSTTIRYQIPLSPLSKGDQGGFQIPVRLAIYDITGRLVETLVNEPLKPGIYQLPISNNQLPSSGIYFYRLTARIGHDSSSPYIATKKMILLR